jgi:hypothetical protein
MFKGLSTDSKPTHAHTECVGQPIDRKYPAFQALFRGCLVLSMATLGLYNAISGAAMQINRLDYLILPGTTATATAKPTEREVLESSVDSGSLIRSSDAAPAATDAQRQSTAMDIPTPETTQDILAGVTLTLNSSKKTDATNTYSRASIAAAKLTPDPPQGINHTPAEQFVASAVRIMHDLEQGNTDALGQDAASFNPGSTSKLANAFGGLRQAAAKLNVFA